MAGRYPGLALYEVCGERLAKQGRINPFTEKNVGKSEQSLVGTYAAPLFFS